MLHFKFSPSLTTHVQGLDPNATNEAWMDISSAAYHSGKINIILDRMQIFGPYNVHNVAYYICKIRNIAFVHELGTSNIIFCLHKSPH